MVADRERRLEAGDAGLVGLDARSSGATAIFLNVADGRDTIGISGASIAATASRCGSARSAAATHA